MSIITNLDNVYGNLQQLVLKNPSYKLTIPEYQREYVWQKEQAYKFWTDMYNALKNDKGINSHYIGNIFLLNDLSSKEFLIIDGQQRITSIMLLLCAIRSCSYDKLEKCKNRGAKDILSALINKIEDNYLYIFETNKVNKDFYNDYIKSRKKINENDSKKILHSYKTKSRERINLPLKIAFDYFYIMTEESLKAATKDSATTEMNAAKHLESLFNCITKHLEIVFLVCTDEKLAYKIFESLNDRGQDLDEVDLIKNKICEEGRLPNTIERWNEMRIAFDDTKRFQRYVNYYYAIKRGKKIPQRSLYKVINDSFENGSLTADALVDELYGTYKQYIFFDIKKKQDRAVFEEDTFVHLAEEFCDCGYIFPSYVMIPCFIEYNNRNYTKDNLYQIFSLCFNTMYRFKSISNGKASEIEEHMISTAVKIRNGESAKSILEHLYNWIESRVPNTKFKNALKNFEDKSGNLAISYALLRRIESYPSSPEGTFTWSSYDRHLITLEHILPKHFEKDSSWIVSFGSSDECKKNINRLGNHCLLESTINNSIKTNSYSDKCNGYIRKGKPVKGYKDSSISRGAPSKSSAKYIQTNFCNWTQTEIDKHQIALSDEGPRVFPINPSELFHC